MATAESPTDSLLDSTFGCLFLAVVFTSIFWGVGCLQLYLYCEKYWDADGKWLKSYLFAIWIFDTVHQALLLNYTYIYFVEGIAKSALLLRVSRSSVHCAIITAFIDAMVQIIFVRRTWYVSNKNKTVTGIVGAAILVQFAYTLVYYARIYKVTPATELTETIHTELALNYIIVLTDTLLAGVLCWLLYKSRPGVKRTDTIINKIIMYTIGSGLLPTILAVVAAIGAQASPQSVIYLLCDLVIPKLYFNSMLASLNVRSSLRASLDHDVSGPSTCLENLTTTPSSPTQRSNDSLDASFKFSSPRPIECRIDIDIESGSFQQEMERKYAFTPSRD